MLVVTQCQVYIKGCATEDYFGVLGAAEYIETNPLTPVVFLCNQCVISLLYYSKYDALVISMSFISLNFIVNPTIYCCRV